MTASIKGTFWQYIKEFPRASGSFGDGPVWFLEALLTFYIFYALWRVIASQANLAARSGWSRTWAVPGNGAIALFALGIGLSTFFIRFWVKAFVYYEPFHFEFARFPQYIALFVAGVSTNKVGLHRLWRKYPSPFTSSIQGSLCRLL